MNKKIYKFTFQYPLIVRLLLLFKPCVIPITSAEDVRDILKIKLRMNDNEVDEFFRVCKKVLKETMIDYGMKKHTHYVDYEGYFFGFAFREGYDEYVDFVLKQFKKRMKERLNES